MAVNVLSYNVFDAFSREKELGYLVGLVEKVDADVAVFPEAYAEGHDEFVGEAASRFMQLGYQFMHGLYDDEDGRKDRHGLIAISRLCGMMAMTRIHNRNAFRLDVYDGETNVPVEIFGVHLDDRTEPTRQQQANSVLGQFSWERPQVVFGDLNTLPSNTFRSRTFRLGKHVWEAMPCIHPGISQEESGMCYLGYKFGQAGSIAQRLAQMATGATLKLFENHGLKDSDPYARPTTKAGPLDHILHSPHLASKNFVVHPQYDGYDHRAISTTILT